MHKQKISFLSEKELLVHAKHLIGKSVLDLESSGISLKVPEGKSGIGNIIESYFNLENNNESEPDFLELGIELKTAPLNKEGKPKFPLTISMIDFNHIKNETWDTAHVRKKLAKILLVFYEPHEDFKQSIIKHVILWSPAESDELLLRADWENIQGKVKQGKADELSETDTWVLVARRKGSKGEMRIVSERDKDIIAKSRCFALRRSFVEMILATKIAKQKEGSLIENLDIEDAAYFVPAIIKYSKQYWGMTIAQIEQTLHLNLNKRSKSYAANVIYHALGLRKNEDYSREFKATGIGIKTVRCNPGLKPIYAMSLRGYDYEEIIDDEWETSKAREDVERMLLVILELPRKRAKQSEARLKAIFLQTPTLDDLSIIKSDWETIVSMIRKGKANELTGHIGEILQTRPKAQKGSDKIKAPGGQLLVKKGFFIRTGYLKKIIKEQLT